jgi:hypothetical protein
LSIRSLAYISILALLAVSLVLYTNTIAHAQAVTTYLTISDENFTLPENASKIMTATLTIVSPYPNGTPVVGENITWSVTVGRIGPTSHDTNDDGQVSVVYSAPSYENVVVYVSAFYAGRENKYTQSSAIAKGTITTPTPINPIEPSSPSTGFSLSDIAIIAIAIICIIVVPAILSGKI